MADCSTPWRQRQETLGRPVMTVLTSSCYDEHWRTRWSQMLSGLHSKFPVKF